jgi:hypothetical protein
MRASDRTRQKAAYKALFNEVLAAYGGRCNCPGCDEWRPAFLSVEHKYGRRRPDGTKDTRTGAKLYRQVKAEGFPDTYTVLCLNCNFAKGKRNSGGRCQHERDRDNLRAGEFVIPGICRIVFVAPRRLLPTIQESRAA